MTPPMKRKIVQMIQSITMLSGKSGFRPVTILLAPFSWIYRLIVAVRNRFYDIRLFPSVDVGVPVVAVGNIEAGGTGKTPLVAMIAERLCGEGKRVAIVSRGYGRESSGPVVVSDGVRVLEDARGGGDEPFELAGRIPSAIVGVDSRRVRIARIIADRWKPDIILMDDGFQHRALRRSLDCVVVDASHNPDRMRLIPSGTLREPYTALQRADLVVLSKVERTESADCLRNFLRTYTTAPVVTMQTVPVAVFDRLKMARLDVRRIRGKRCVSFCGIGSPEAFVNTVEEMGVSNLSVVKFPDHHFYTERDIALVTDRARKYGAELVLTTEKDAGKLSLPMVKMFAPDAPLMSVLVSVTISEGDDILWSMIRKTIR